MVTRASHERRSRFGTCSVAAAVLFAVTSAGCPPPKAPPTVLPAAEHTVRILFNEKNCPFDVKPVETPCDPKKPQCFHAHNGETVAFQAWSGDQAVQQEFELQFDPFKRAPLKSGSGHLQAKIDVAVVKEKGPKEFTYNVLSGTCPPIDPQIIVDW